MWWESIPSFSVIVGGMGLIPMVVYVINQFQLGNAYRRSITYNADAHLFFRDERVSGTDNPYLQKGLENIPDEESNTPKAENTKGTAK